MEFPSSGAMSASTPLSYAVPAVEPDASTVRAPICDGTLSQLADFSSASMTRKSANGSGSGYTLKLNFCPGNFLNAAITRSCCSGSRFRGSRNLANSRFASAACCSALAARSLEVAISSRNASARSMAAPASLRAIPASLLAFPACWFSCDLSACCCTSSMCCNACSLRLNIQCLTPKPTSPTIPTATNMANIWISVSRVASADSSSAFVTLNDSLLSL